MINLNEYVCTVPFKSMEIHDESYVLSCARWLTKHLPKNQPMDGMWNSEESIDIRKSVMDGTYRNCDKTQCPYLSQLINLNNKSLGPIKHINELPEDMIERAIKENRVDELSTEIATKALEIYKTQFGTEGLSGIMIASVDENKFKQEVAKLIEPAIKEITTKMDEKLKQVQDVVSGGINPTA